MPYINTKLSIPLDESKEVALKSALGRAIEAIPGKTEKWLMLDFEDNCRLWFAGDNSAPTAFVEVKIFGSASDGAYAALTSQITNILEEITGIDPARIYVKYDEISTWGWNGSNF